MHQRPLAELQREQVRKQLPTMRIINLALAAGTITFAIIALAIRPNPAGFEPLLAYLAIGFAATALLAWGIIPLVLKNVARKKLLQNQADKVPRHDLAAERPLEDIDALCNIYQTQTIVRGAILEGAAFFCLIVFFLGGPWFTIAAAGVLVLVILAQTPSTSRVEHWIVSTFEEAEISRELPSRR
jgi:hypothetical protein